MKFFIDTANVDEIRKANDMGVIAGVTPAGMIVQCRSGRVRIAEVQGAGGKRMPADAFFRGHAALLYQRFQQPT